MADVETDGAARLDIKVEHTSSGPIVALTGDLDLSNAAQLEAVLDRLLDTRPEQLLFDLGGLRFMDSSGIALLLRAAATVPTVAVVRPSAIVRRLLQTTGLTELLHIDA